MMIKCPLPLLLSLLTHLLILFWLWKGNGLKDYFLRDSSLQTVTVSYQESKGSADSHKYLDNQSRKNWEKIKTRKKKIPLSSLVPHFSIGPSSKTRPSEPPTSLSSWRDSSFYDGIGSPHSSQRPNLNVEQISFAQSLWRAVDRNIEENPFLSEYNHTGQAFFRFMVDEGKLVPGSLHASASDRILKVIAARALRSALDRDNEDVRWTTGSLWINARFSWSDYGACERLRGVDGNNLSFCHYAENKRKSFSVGEKTTTWLGALYQHGPWAYEDIQHYRRQERRRKSKFNPFEQYELDPDWNL